MAFGEKMPLPVLAALLCLGKKYDIHKLHVDARRRLFESFPITLKKSDTVTLWHGLEETDDIYFQLLLIARRAEPELVSILPRALYECCQQYSTYQIKNGISINGSVVRLSPEDQITLLAGHRAIREALADTTHDWLLKYQAVAHAQGCITPGHCYTSRLETFVSIFSFKSTPCGLEDWAHISGELMDELCKYCTKTARAEHAIGRNKLWDQLPGLFDLPAWDELLKEREELYVLSYITIELLSGSSHIRRE